MTQLNTWHVLIPHKDITAPMSQNLAHAMAREHPDPDAKAVQCSRYTEYPDSIIYVLKGAKSPTLIMHTTP